MSLIKSVGKKVIRRFVEPPWNSDIMEFQHGVWRGVSPLFTESGRQLGEENARPFLFNDHIPAKTITCKYEGSRQGHPINMSALKIAMSNFDAALEITRAVIRTHARAAMTSKPNATAGIWDLYVIALASIALVAYSVRKRPNNKPSAVVPDDLASQYQFIAGIFMICRHMIDNDSDAIRANTLVTAIQLYEYADEHEIFTSFNGMVCAGSTKKIMEFLEFCIAEMDLAFSDANHDKKDQNAKALGMIEGVDQWYQYAVASIELDCFVKTARRTHRISKDSASASHDQKTMATYQNIADYCSALSPQLNAPSDLSFEEGALIRQNTILRLLNRQPIKKMKQAQLDEQLGYD